MKKTKKLLVYKKKNSRQNLFILMTAGDSWQLLATPWRLLATPGAVCILVVPVVPNKR